MNHDERETLYARLRAAYTEETLTRITANLIAWYKQGGERIDRLALRMSHVIPEREIRTGKRFARLVMLYHPDRLAHYRDALAAEYAKGTAGDMTQFAHILLVLDDEDAPIPFPTREAFEYDVEWGYDDDDLDATQTYDVVDEDVGDDEGTPISFLEALKRMEYGTLEVQADYSAVEYWDEALTLSAYHIDDLWGLHVCRNLVRIDLSHNEITAIGALAEHARLQEVDLSYNAITDVDALAALDDLVYVDIAFNDVDDISPLFSLSNLTYVNVVGNPVPHAQIARLVNAGVFVAYAP